VVTLHRQTVRWTWFLTNQQGYRDGIQFEFFDGDFDGNEDVAVQLMCEASRFTIHVLAECPQGTAPPGHAADHSVDPHPRPTPP